MDQLRNVRILFTPNCQFKQIEPHLRNYPKVRYYDVHFQRYKTLSASPNTLRPHTMSIQILLPDGYLPFSIPCTQKFISFPQIRLCSCIPPFLRMGPRLADDTRTQGPFTRWHRLPTACVFFV